MDVIRLSLNPEPRDRADLDEKAHGNVIGLWTAALWWYAMGGATSCHREYGAIHPSKRDHIVPPTLLNILTLKFFR